MRVDLAAMFAPSSSRSRSWASPGPSWPAQGRPFFWFALRRRRLLARRRRALVRRERAARQACAVKRPGARLMRAVPQPPERATRRGTRRAAPQPAARRQAPDGRRCSAISSLVSGCREAVYPGADLPQIARRSSTAAHKITSRNIHLGSIHLHASVHTLLADRARPGDRPAADADPARRCCPRGSPPTCRRACARTCSTPSRAPPGGCSPRDREGHLQETMTSQVMQATGGALQATGTDHRAASRSSSCSSPRSRSTPVAAGVRPARGACCCSAPAPAERARRAARPGALPGQLEYAGGRQRGDPAGRGDPGVRRRRGAARRGRRADRHTPGTLFFRTQVLGRLTPNIYQSLIYLILVGGLAGAARTRQPAMSRRSARSILLLCARAPRPAGPGLLPDPPPGAALHRAPAGRERALLRTASPPDGDVALPQRRDARLPGRLLRLPTRPAGALRRQLRGRRAASHRHHRAVGCGQVDADPDPAAAAPPDQRALSRQRRARRAASRATDWHRRVAYVPQEPRLLHASVAENIRFFRDSTTRRSNGPAGWPASTRTSWAGEGYETIVGPRADAVSGGQQQRICLARALAAQPEVLCSTSRRARSTRNRRA